MQKELTQFEKVIKMIRAIDDGEFNQFAYIELLITTEDGQEKIPLWNLSKDFDSLDKETQENIIKNY